MTLSVEFCISEVPLILLKNLTYNTCCICTSHELNWMIVKHSEVAIIKIKLINTKSPKS